MVKDVIVSSHASDRMLERYSFEKTVVKQVLTERAWKNGKTHRDYSGKIARFLYNTQTRYSNEGYIVKTHGNKFFVFTDNGVLCTVFDEPKMFQKLKSRSPIYREEKNGEYDFSEVYNYTA